MPPRLRGAWGACPAHRLLRGVPRAGDPQEGPGCFSLSVLRDEAWREARG